jgi:glycine/D-amino acid oxidase-like deaminating enzyme
MSPCNSRTKIEISAEDSAHVRSYYASTINDRTRYPRLTGRLRFDVCIIGSGFSGLSTAIFLADQGASVAVVEARRVGWGASGRNGGQIIGGISGEARIAAELGEEGRHLVHALWYRGHEIIEQQIDRFGICCDFKRGVVEAAVKPRHFDELQRFHERAAGVLPDYNSRWLSRQEMTDAFGTEAYCGGLLDPRGAHCHPLNLCLGEARGAASLGVRIFEQSPVLDIRHGLRPQVITAEGAIDAGTVVLAGNAYHALEQNRLAGLVFRAGTYMVASEPMEEPIARGINRLDAAVADGSIVPDYFRLSADRRLLFGGLCNYSGRPPGSIAQALRPHISRVWPELAGIRIDYEWGGDVAIVISRVPLIGRSAPNIFFLQGYSGHGVNVSHLAGEIVAEAIAGRSERLEMFERVRQIRVPVGRKVGNWLLALGMAYYRLKDIR